MGLLDRIKGKNRRAGENKPTVVVFAGGMGTQIIQAATYFALKDAGHPTYADLSYFETESRMAATGNPGQATHWFWQIDQFGLPQSAFEPPPPGLDSRSADMLPDGPRMMELGLQALTRPDIQAHFVDVSQDLSVLSKEVLKSFLCIHVRRGDYVNVASHLVSDQQFSALAKQFSGLVEHVVVLSDSPISQALCDALSPPWFSSTAFLDDIDPYTAHRIMRHARVLVCSNSTFSLTAAMLNPDALVLFPKQWFGEQDRAIEIPIHALSSFEIRN